jgi:CDGSH-type Zn-finger protein
LPIAVITILTACATAVALAAGKGRAQRARVVLGRLLDALCALCRCGRSRR